VRILGVDFGQRRLGVALSDPTALLATPWRSVPAGRTPAISAAAIISAIEELRATGDDIAAIVVGLPRRLNGDDTDQTAPARDFARALHDHSGLPVHLQDERLSSHEAESRLALRERDWRKRKAKLDAAAAAVILQDFLDAHAHERVALER
jgi:putative Holliday junction resolvase